VSAATTEEGLGRLIEEDKVAGVVDQEHGNRHDVAN
jgi:hypothetical protein